MTSAHNTPTVQPGELLDDSALLSLEDLARSAMVGTRELEQVDTANGLLPELEPAA